MYAIEVLKGSSQVQYGPFTTGGAINLVSTPIPKKFTARLNASFGSFATGKAYALVGNGGKYGGWLVEYLHYRSNGFRHAQGHEEMGFRRHDLNTKFLVQTANEDGINHRLTLKFGYAQEHSDETYLGLTEADFATHALSALSCCTARRSHHTTSAVGSHLCARWGAIVGR